jgi:sporulation protein YabP
MGNENKLILIGQRNLTISGIKKMLAVSESSISLQLENTAMNVAGEKMEVRKLDVEAGILEVEGKITNIKYISAREKVGLIKRIFK